MIESSSRPSWLRFGAVAAAALLAATPAFAATLPFQAQLTIQLGPGFTGEPAITVTGSGVATVNGSGSGLALTALAIPATAFSTTGAIQPVTDPLAAPVQGLQLTMENAAGGFAVTGGGHLGGAMALAGALRVCLFMPCGAPVANIVVPLTPVGVGGTAQAVGAVNVTVTGAPWTTGTVTAVAPVATAMGFAHGPATATGSTAQAGGLLQLVTPIVVSTNASADEPRVAFGVLTIEFVPEPATGALLIAGLACVASLGRRRTRHLQ
jgi:hypothetical protein